MQALTPTLTRSQAVDQLTEVERTVLAERKATLLSTLDQGFGPLTWTSLCIPEFIAAVQQVCLAAQRFWFHGVNPAPGRTGGLLALLCLCSCLPEASSAHHHQEHLQPWQLHLGQATSPVPTGPQASRPHRWWLCQGHCCSSRHATKPNTLAVHEEPQGFPGS